MEKQKEHSHFSLDSLSSLSSQEQNLVLEQKELLASFLGVVFVNVREVYNSYKERLHFLQTHESNHFRNVFIAL